MSGKLSSDKVVSISVYFFWSKRLTSQSTHAIFKCLHSRSNSGFNDVGKNVDKMTLQNTNDNENDLHVVE